MTKEIIAGPDEEFAPSRKEAKAISGHAEVLADEITRSIEPHPQIAKLAADLKTAPAAEVDRNKEVEAHAKAAYYKGRGVGKKIERSKRERMIEGFIERAKSFKDRAISAESKIREYKEAAMVHGIMDFDGLIKEMEGLRHPDPDESLLGLIQRAQKFGRVVLEREKVAKDLADYDAMKEKLAAANRSLDILFNGGKEHCTKDEPMNRHAEAVTKIPLTAPESYAAPRLANLAPRYPLYTKALLEKSLKEFIEACVRGGHTPEEAAAITRRFNEKRQEYVALEMKEAAHRAEAELNRPQIGIIKDWSHVVFHYGYDGKVTHLVNGIEKEFKPGMVFEASVPFRCPL